MDSQKPTVGRIVHFTLDHGPNAGQARPAMVVRVWNDTCVQLQVFMDGTNDGPEYTSGLRWCTSVHHAAEPTAGRWHWPPRA
jgi:hypothetical protein